MAYKYAFGEVIGINEGGKFPCRAELREAGIHLVLMAGIDGNPKEGESSIVLNGEFRKCLIKPVSCSGIQRVQKPVMDCC